MHFTVWIGILEKIGKKSALKVKARSARAPFLFLLGVIPYIRSFLIQEESVPESAAGMPSSSSNKGPESIRLSPRAFLSLGANQMEHPAKAEGPTVNVVLSVCWLLAPQH